MNNIIYNRSDYFKPDFNNLLSVINRKKPERPTLFEFGINNRIIGKLTGEHREDTSSRTAPFKRLIKSFKNAGYDYTTISAWRTNTLNFPKGCNREKGEQII